MVFIWDRLPVGVVAFGVALSLWATGILGQELIKRAGDNRTRLL